MLEKIKRIINYLKEHPKVKSFILLLFWIIFIGIVITLINNSNNVSSPTPNQKENESSSIVKLQEKLQNNNYNFEYIIKENDNYLKYYGQRKGTEIVYYKDTQEGILKYYQKENENYNVVNNELIPADKDENLTYLDLQTILNLIPISDIQEDETGFSFENNEIRVKIKRNEQNIEINLFFSNIEYKIIYFNINGVTSLTY